MTNLQEAGMKFTHDILPTLHIEYPNQAENRKYGQEDGQRNMTITKETKTTIPKNTKGPSSKNSKMKTQKRK